jgi:diacylglycerol kinase (ATP)
VVKPRNILIFANPISGQGRGLRIADSIAAEAHSAGYHVELYFSLPTTAPDAVIPEDGVVIAVGGDGTLRCVVDRLLTATAAGRAMPPMMTVPLGTANLVARHLRCKWNERQIGRELLRAIDAGAGQQLDISRVNGNAMLAVAGVGFDAQVVHDLCARRKGPITYADYLLPTFRSITGYRFPAVSLAIDGRSIADDVPGIAFVGNIPEYGAGFSVTPKARADDGLLDVCFLPCNSWQDLFELGVICGAEHQIHSERAIYRRGRHVEITSAVQVPLQIDGDGSGFTPVTIDLLDQQVTFIVPAR